jgi:polyisoprenoid-binding protein YceI
MHRRHLLIGLAALLAGPVGAAPQRYAIGAGGARIRFTFQLNNAPVTGEVPLSGADVRIDPDNLATSTVDARADVSRAKTGLVFATQAMKSASVLDADRFPEARFVSTRVRLGSGGRISDGATVDGQLTLRGVTHPIRLSANIYRPKGSAAEDLSRLDVRLNGHLSRTRFGMTGYPKLVADRVALSIRANIEAR